MGNREIIPSSKGYEKCQQRFESLQQSEKTSWLNASHCALHRGRLYCHLRDLHSVLSTLHFSINQLELYMKNNSTMISWLNNMSNKQLNWMTLLLQLHLNKTLLLAKADLWTKKSKIKLRIPIVYWVLD